MLRRLGSIGVVVAALSLAVAAQMRVAPVDDEQGHVALGLALRHLANTGVFMHATAHPDDENNGLLVMLNRGEGYRTALATATRGNGGQNEIGPEIFEALGVLRTEELAAMHRFDGAEQYFTRAVDFGNSFSIEETFEKWGREEIVADFVRLIRMVRPDVILSLHPEGDGGGQHHQASAILARVAFTLAGDATRYPDQLKDGLRPWQPRKFYHPIGFPGSGRAAGAAGNVLSIDLATYDPLLGKTYDEIGTEARSMHKCQGMAQLLSLPGPAVSTFQLVESTIPGQSERRERSLFDGVDHSIPGLAQFAGAQAPRELTDGLSAIASAVQAAQRAFDSQNDGATLQPLLEGLRAVRALRTRLPALALAADGRFEIDFRLRQKEREFQQAALIANGVRVEVLADDGVVVPGQPLRVSVVVGNRGAADVTVKEVRFEGFEGGEACALTPVTSGGGGGPFGRGRPAPSAPAAPISTLRTGQAGRCEPTLTLPAAARPTEPYWHRAGEAGRYTVDVDAPFGLPYRPTPFHASVTLVLAGAGSEGIVSRLPVQYRYEGNIFSGEKRSDLLVVPAWSVRVSPAVAILPASALPPAGPGPTASGAIDGQREIYVTVINGSKGPVEGVVRLDLPERWTSTPAGQPISFSREDESRTVRFQLRAAPNSPLGEYRVVATAVVLSLQDGLGAGSTLTLAEAETEARNSAVSMLSKHRSGDLNETPVDGARDVRFGQRYIDPSTGAWVEQWGVSPYNMVEVTVRRMKQHDTEVPLFFAPILGHSDADLTATSVAATYPGAGFQIPAGSNDKVHILPFAVDLQTWTDYMTDYSNNYSFSGPLDPDMMMASSEHNIFSTTLTAGVFLMPGNGNGNGSGSGWTQQTFTDNYSYNEETKTVVQGNDNIPELNIYPDLDTQLPPGNRGMVDMGSPNNSTADVKRQIEEGLNAYDFSFFPNNEIRTDQGPIQLNGDTGISAGIQNSLETIAGRTSAIPIYTEVTGNGNNAYYTVVKFVGVRLMHSKLSGGPNNRHVLIQPAPFYSTTVIRGTGMPYADSLLTQPINVR